MKIGNKSIIEKRVTRWQVKDVDVEEVEEGGVERRVCITQKEAWGFKAVRITVKPRMKK